MKAALSVLASLLVAGGWALCYLVAGREHTTRWALVAIGAVGGLLAVAIVGALVFAPADVEVPDAVGTTSAPTLADPTTTALSDPTPTPTSPPPTQAPSTAIAPPSTSAPIVDCPDPSQVRPLVVTVVERIEGEPCAFAKADRRIPIPVLCPPKWICAGVDSVEVNTVYEGHGQGIPLVLAATWRFPPAYPASAVVHDFCAFVAEEDARDGVTTRSVRNDGSSCP